jgi:L,D-transpeptidase YcbB
MRGLIFILCILFFGSEQCRILTESYSPDRQQAGSRIDSLTFADPSIFSPASLKEFYKGRDFRLAWFHNDQLTQPADSLILLLGDLRHFGLTSRDYPVDRLDSLLLGRNINSMVQADVLLTDSYFRLATQLRDGRFDRATLNMQTHYGKDTALIASLNTSLKTESMQPLLQHEPSLFQYKALKQLLYKSTDSNEIMKLVINLQRWRWEAPQFPERYILVNIPAYQLDVVDRGKKILSSRVIVGQPEKKTPVFASTIDCIVIYPYWHVPREIAVNEMLPKIKADTNYLEANHLELLDTGGNILDPYEFDWSKYSRNNFPFRLRQREGTDNALGVIKFYMENPYGVYLHDTNSPSLFRKSKRALSHGCVRVEKALELAAYLIDYDSGKIDSRKLRAYIANKTRKEITLRKGAPVLVRYFTADEKGAHADVYNFDPALEAAFGAVDPSIEWKFRLTNSTSNSTVVHRSFAERK